METNQTPIQAVVEPTAKLPAVFDDGVVCRSHQELTDYLDAVYGRLKAPKQPDAESN